MLGEIAPAMWAELLKLRRSKVPAITIAAFTLAGAVGGFFMFVLQDPRRARSLGLLRDKAQFVGGPANWSGSFALTAQIVAVGGLLVFGLLIIWLFGREFSDRTAKDLLALPTPRSAIVAAKLVIAIGWSLLLAVHVTLLGLIFGAALGLPGWSTSTALRGVGTVLAVALLTSALAITYGLVASIGRGFLVGVATMLASLFAAQIIAALGFGNSFPWSVPALLSGAAGPDHAPPGGMAIAGVVLVGLAASAASALWWERADHDR